MGRCSIARRPLDKLGTSRHRRADGVGQRYLIPKGQQPKTYDQHADDDGCAGDATVLITVQAVIARSVATKQSPIWQEIASLRSQ